MSEYCFNRQFENETKVRIETNDRKLLLGLEQAINDFISNFKNENEETDGIENIEWIRFENELNFGIENEEAFENELQSINENLSDKFCGNELQISKKIQITNKNKTKSPPPINTKFGRAYWSGTAYFIRDKNYPQNNNKLLHKLIYEDSHKCTVLQGNHIHHIDGNPANNNLNNLQLLSASDHGKISAKYNQQLHNQINQSRKRNTSGYFRVCKLKGKKSPYDDMWRYLYMDNGKQKAIVAKSIPKLKEKVIAEGLHWEKL